jgi:hypothetical protein
MATVTLEVKYPPLRHIDARERRPGHRHKFTMSVQSPSGSKCREFRRHYRYRTKPSRRTPMRIRRLGALTRERR